jgi:hypothetical protein
MLLQRQADICDTRLVLSVAQNDGEAYALPLNRYTRLRPINRRLGGAVMEKFAPPSIAKGKQTSNPMD